MDLEVLRYVAAIVFLPLFVLLLISVATGERKNK